MRYGPALFGGRTLIVSSDVYGLRGWRPGPALPSLYSYSYAYAWTPGVNTAEHTGWGAGPGQCKGILDKACTCGFYSYTTDRYEHYRRMFGPHLPVWGVIRNTGRMVGGTHGFRAEHAEIVALTCAADGDNDVTRALADSIRKAMPAYVDRYQVPWLPTPEVMLAEYPCPPLPATIEARETEGGTP